MYFPRPTDATGHAVYRLSGPIRVHGSVNRIIGMKAMVNVADSH